MKKLLDVDALNALSPGYYKACHKSSLFMDLTKLPTGKWAMSENHFPQGVSVEIIARNFTILIKA